MLRLPVKLGWGKSERTIWRESGIKIHRNRIILAWTAKAGAMPLESGKSFSGYPDTTVLPNFGPVWVLSPRLIMWIRLFCQRPLTGQQRNVCGSRVYSLFSPQAGANWMPKEIRRASAELRCYLMVKGLWLLCLAVVPVIFVHCSGHDSREAHLRFASTNCPLTGKAKILWLWSGLEILTVYIWSVMLVVNWCLWVFWLRGSLREGYLSGQIASMRWCEHYQCHRSLLPQSRHNIQLVSLIHNCIKDLRDRRKVSFILSDWCSVQKFLVNQY